MSETPAAPEPPGPGRGERDTGRTGSPAEPGTAGPERAEAEGTREVSTSEDQGTTGTATREDAAEPGVAPATGAPAAGMPPIDQLQGRPIGRVLTKMGKVTREQIVEALTFQKSKGGALGRILIDLGYIKETDLNTALAAQRGYEFVSLDGVKIDAAAIAEMFDAKLAKTTPESAAKTILGAVARNRPRSVVGYDAKFLDGVVRLLGPAYQRLVVFGSKKAMPSTPAMPAAVGAAAEIDSRPANKPAKKASA